MIGFVRRLWTALRSRPAPLIHLYDQRIATTDQYIADLERKLDLYEERVRLQRELSRERRREDDRGLAGR